MHRSLTSAISPIVVPRQGCDPCSIPELQGSASIDHGAIVRFVKADLSDSVVVPACFRDSLLSANHTGGFSGIAIVSASVEGSAPDAPS